MRIRNYLIVVWLILPLAGCASMTDSTYEMTQMLHARSAWKRVPDCAKIVISLMTSNSVGKMATMTF